MLNNPHLICKTANYFLYSTWTGPWVSLEKRKTLGLVVVMKGSGFNPCKSFGDDLEAGVRWMEGTGEEVTFDEQAEVFYKQWLAERDEIKSLAKASLSKMVEAGYIVPDCNAQGVEGYRITEKGRSVLGEKNDN